SGVVLGGEVGRERLANSPRNRRVVVDSAELTGDEGEGLLLVLRGQRLDRDVGVAGKGHRGASRPARPPGPAGGGAKAGLTEALQPQGESCRRERAEALQRLLLAGRQRPRAGDPPPPLPVDGSHQQEWPPQRAREVTGTLLGVAPPGNQAEVMALEV